MFLFFHICNLNFSPLLTYVLHDNGIPYEKSIGTSSCCWEQFCSWIFPMTGPPKISTLSQHEPMGIESTNYLCPKKKNSTKRGGKNGHRHLHNVILCVWWHLNNKIQRLGEGARKDHGKRKVVSVYRPT